MTAHSSPNPHDPALRIDQEIALPARQGMARTLYFYSYSGAIVIDGALPVLEGEIDGMRFEIQPPVRIGSPALRPTPQFTPHSIGRFFRFEGNPQFPFQIASFAAPATEAGASVSYWNGPGDEANQGTPDLPRDTLIVTLHGPDSGRYGQRIEKYLLRPILEWLRALTDQWWIGRSYEGISGALHFIAPLDREGKMVGKPTPVTAMTTGGPRMIPVSPSEWVKAADNAVAGVPPAELGLSTDAKFMLASHEFRSAIILACCAFEAARDRVLDEKQVKLRSLPCSPTDLLKHLSSGFESQFGRNLELEEPETFAALRSFWIARGDAAHGRPVEWRSNGQAMPIDAISPSLLTESIDSILKWTLSVSAHAGSGDTEGSGDTITN